MKYCPKCGTFINTDVCSNCGWSINPQITPGSAKNPLTKKIATLIAGVVGALILAGIVPYVFDDINIILDDGNNGDNGMTGPVRNCIFGSFSGTLSCNDESETRMNTLCAGVAGQPPTQLGSITYSEAVQLCRN